MDISTTGSEFTVTSGHDTAPETSGISSIGIPSWSTPLTALATGPTSQGRHSPWTPPWPRKTSQPMRRIGVCGKEEERSSPSGSGSYPPMVQQPERHQESCHLALLHSLRHGWRQLAHNNTCPGGGLWSGGTNGAVGGELQAYQSKATSFTNAGQSESQTRPLKSFLMRG